MAASSQNINADYIPKNVHLLIKYEFIKLLNGCFDETKTAHIRSPSVSATDLGALVVEKWREGWYKITFPSVLECLQAILIHNNRLLRSPDESSRIIFFNPKKQQDCKIDTEVGLAHTGKVLYMRHIQKDLGYIPFHDLNQAVIDIERFQAMKAECARCDKKFTLLGIHLDLDFIAAKCDSCDYDEYACPFNRGYTFPNESFARLVQYKEANFKIFYDICFLPMKSRYENAKEFLKIVGPLEAWEWGHTVRNFHQNSVDGNLGSVDTDTREISDDGVCTTINVILPSSSVSFWTTRARSRVKSITVVLQVTNGEASYSITKDALSYAVQQDRTKNIFLVSAQVMMNPAHEIVPNSLVRLVPYPKSTRYEESVAFYNKWASGVISNSWLTRMLDLTSLEAKSMPIIDRGNLEHKENKESYSLILAQLNNEQKNAVENAMKHDISLVTGSPGTGKTLTSATILVLTKLRNPEKKAIALGLGDTICDSITVLLNNLLEKGFRSTKKPFCVLRVYTPYQALVGLQRTKKVEFGKYVDVLHNLLETEILGGNNAHLKRILQVIKCGKYSTLTTDDKGYWMSETAKLEQQIIRSSSYKIIVASLGAFHSGLFFTQSNQPRYDNELLLVEDANCIKHTEFLPILQSKPIRLVMSGDEESIRKFISSPAVEKAKNGISTFYWILKSKSKVPVVNLTTNYRLSGSMLKLLSKLFYNEKALMYKPVIIAERFQYAITYTTSNVIIYNYTGDEEIREGSVCNLTEVNVIKSLCEDMLTEGKLEPNDILVLSFYHLQEKHLKLALEGLGVETGLVESFQSKERNVVILAFTRSVGVDFGLYHLLCRLHLGLSRAKEAVIMVMDERCFTESKDPETFEIIYALERYADIRASVVT